MVTFDFKISESLKKKIDLVCFIKFSETLELKYELESF